MRGRSRRIAAVALLAGALAAGPAVADRAIRGTSGDDRIDAGAGADRVRALAGDDTVLGGTGRDRIWAGLGEDNVSGGPGRDRLFINEVRDVDSLGDDDGDRADGGPGRDRIFARDGERDEIVCGTGRDRVRADQFDAVASDCERKRVNRVTAAGLQRRMAVACRAVNARARHGGDDDDACEDRDRDRDDGNSGPG